MPIRRIERGQKLLDAASISVKKILSTQPSPIRAPQPGERKRSSFSSLLKTLSSPLRGTLASLAPYIEETQKHARILARTTSGQHILGCATCHLFLTYPYLMLYCASFPQVQPEEVVKGSLKPPITVRSPPICSRSANTLLALQMTRRNACISCAAQSPNT